MGWFNHPTRYWVDPIPCNSGKSRLVGNMAKKCKNSGGDHWEGGQAISRKLIFPNGIFGPFWATKTDETGHPKRRRLKSLTKLAEKKVPAVFEFNVNYPDLVNPQKKKTKTVYIHSYWNVCKDRTKNRVKKIQFGATLKALLGVIVYSFTCQAVLYVEKIPATTQLLLTTILG